MSKKLFVLIPLVLLLAAPSLAAVGIFENDKDIGGPRGIGSVVDQGFVWKSDHLAQQYLFTAGGADIWDNADHFHFAYRTMTGDVRVTASYDWVAASNDWAKVETMLRATDAANSIHYAAAGRKGASYANDYGGMQFREVTGAGSGAIDAWKPAGSAGPKALAIQRVTVGGLPWIESLVDWGLGAGLQSVGIKLAFNLPNTVLAGVAVTSHDNNNLGQAKVYDVKYETKPALVGTLTFTKVPEAAAQAEPCTNIPGFKIRSIKSRVGTSYAQMDELLDTGAIMGVPGYEEGSRIDPVVNLRDTGDGAFGNNRSYPGIDPFEYPAADPAAGDDDNDFVTEILACIKLTKGLHIIGANSDDGTIIKIGGVEVARTGEWKGADNQDFIYEVAKEGWYSLRARTLEGGGGASIELHEILMNGTRILLGDVAAGGSQVVVPEPATIALLGLGGLALLGSRKRS